MLRILSGPIQRLLEEDDGANATSGSSPKTDLSGIAAASQATQDSHDASETTKAADNDLTSVSEGEEPPDFSKISAPPEPEKTPEATQPTKEAEKPAGEAPEAKTEPVKAAEKKEEPPKSVIPDDDKDLDAIQPNTSNPRVVKSISGMKEVIKETRNEARTYRSEAENLRKEIETLKAQPPKTEVGIPEEVTKELEELRQHKFLTTDDDALELQQRFEKPVTDADQALFDYLKSDGLQDAVIAEIKAHGVTKWGRWEELFNAVTNPITKLEIQGLVMRRNEAERAKQSSIAKFKTDREGYMKSIQERKSKSVEEFGNQLHQESLKLVADKEWIMPGKLPENASAEVKARHEKEVAEKEAQRDRFIDYAKRAYSRDPKITAEVAFKAIYADHLEKQIEAKTKELETAKARAEDLENQIASIRKAGKTTSRPATTEVIPASEEEIGGEVGPALNKFLRSK